MRNAANTAVLFATAIAGSLSFVGRLFSDGEARQRRQTIRTAPRRRRKRDRASPTVRRPVRSQRRRREQA